MIGNRIILGFLQVAELVIHPEMQSFPNSEKDQIQWIIIVQKDFNDEVKFSL